MLLLLLLLAAAAGVAEASCAPATVTCCFSAFSQVVQVYVDEQDVTATVQGDLADYTQTKTITFPEPQHYNATLAIKARERNEVAHGSLTVHCQCDRAGCLWNFDSEAASGQWKGMPALVYHTDSLSPGWFLNNRTAGLKQVVQSTDQALATLDAATCGGGNGVDVSRAQRLRAVQTSSPRNEYFAFRRQVQGGRQCPPTPAPSPLPTIKPSLRPTTLQPTTLAVPQPTLNPSDQCVPDTVTCCFTGGDRILAIFVNEIDLTLSVTPYDKLDDSSVVKTVTFLEPSVSASVAVLLDQSSTRSGFVRMRCSTPRTASAWNFVMDNSFLAVSVDASVDLLSGLWSRNGFLGINLGLVLNLGGLVGGLVDLILPPSSQCGGSLLGLDVLRPLVGGLLSPLFAVRKLIAPKDTGACQPTCQPAQVTCCFTSSQPILQLFVNELDVTLNVLPYHQMNDSSVVKSVTFLEPAISASIAVLGLNGHINVGGSGGGVDPSFQMRCSTPRAASAWNFIMDGSFLALKADVLVDLDANWFTNSYVSASASLGVSLLPVLDWLLPVPSTCGGTGALGALTNTLLRPLLGTSPLFVLRKLIHPVDFGACAPTCQPAQVTCCFTAGHQLLKLYVDEIDITARIAPFHLLNDSSVIKTVTFDEPSSAATLAILALDANIHAPALVNLRCASTRALSPWNLLVDDSFLALKADVAVELDLLGSTSSTGAWYKNSFLLGAAVSASVDVSLQLGLVDMLLGLPPTCGGGAFGYDGNLNALSVWRGTSPYFGLRKLITPRATSGGGGACVQQCVQDTVTCCFTSSHSILGLIVDEVDITLSITPLDKLNDSSVVKVVTFPEPNTLAAINLLGLEANLLLNPHTRMRCTSTRRDSAWNFVSDNAFSVLSVSALVDLDASWYRNSYVGVDVGLGLNLGNILGNVLDLLLPSNTCGGGSLLGLDALFPFRGLNPIFALRRLVHPRKTCVRTTRAPTPAPTRLPTPVPTFKPTASPTVCQPATVTCCLTANEKLLKFHVNGVDLTAQVSPPNKLEDFYTPKVVSFTEPAGNATIAIMGYEAPLLGLLSGVSVNMRCGSTRAESAWNFVAGPDFTALSASSATGFPANWYTNAYTSTASTGYGVPSLVVDLLALPSSCGGLLSSLTAVAPNKGTDRYFAMRKLIPASGECTP